MSEKSILLAERRRNDKAISALRRTHEILESTAYTSEEKYVMLVSEQGFGKVRAQELVFGKVIFKDEYHSVEDNRGFEKYYLVGDRQK